ncbi:uncharacterized protein LOC132063809 [Lycium ferocissimum]|uniref:uncharacterized protein LOC132063809 n=1 Tax=Lycium ferocissimum TaxID=112874 RepID=UPI002815513F|nr:uncharacterized protein LOC132063809 [Lycium ferocissimum]
MEAFTRLRKMHQKYQYGFFGLLEPFQDADKIEEYRRKKGLQHAFVNCFNKIWAIVEDMFEVTILVDHPQKLTLKLRYQGNMDKMVVILVYAKCTQIERLELWESLEDLSVTTQLPWMIGGDFNVIISEEEKYGGLPVTIHEVQDFKTYIQNCSVVDLGFKGGETEVVKKPFKFLNLWAKHDTFVNTVKEHWKADFMANPFNLFHYKMKKEIETLEDVIKLREIQFDLQPTPTNRERLHKVQANLNRYFHLEEEFWKQKAGMQWFRDGEKSTAFSMLMCKNGNWIESQEDLSQEEIRFFSKQFTKEEDPTDFEILDHVPQMINADQNNFMKGLPIEEEVKNVVFSLNRESTAGPDGFTGVFY